MSPGSLRPGSGRRARAEAVGARGQGAGHGGDGATYGAAVHCGIVRCTPVQCGDGATYGAAVRCTFRAFAHVRTAV